MVAGAIQVRSSRRCAEGGEEVGDDGLDLGLGFGGEVTLRVDLADGVAEGAVDEDVAALVAGALLRCAGEGLAEEVEALVGEGFGEARRRWLR